MLALSRKTSWLGGAAAFAFVALAAGLAGSAPAAPAPAAAAPAPVKVNTFTDYRGQAPGRSHLIRPGDMPLPNATPSVDNDPKLVPRPKDAWPQAPEGFKVQLYADKLSNPRLLRTAPNGDVFVVESKPGLVRAFRGLGPDGRAVENKVFARGFKQPFGIAFYPPSGEPQWIYVANTDSVVRFPYKSGELEARGKPETVVTSVPGGGRLHGGGHWTRDIAFSLDGKTLFVSVGSLSNVDDPDETPAEKNRAVVLAFDANGGAGRVYASGIRNAVGIAVHPRSGALWASVNERDLLGDNLVPDYITSVREGGFYGWPWYYIGGNQDPRHQGKHPELKDKVIVPDVLLQPHFASLQMVFYQGKMFPAAYRGDIFAAQHGSWNRAVRTGYQVIRVPMNGTDKAAGGYEDFLTGFVTAKGEVWGRPVGVTVAGDGALLVTDDGSNSIWRVSTARDVPLLPSDLPAMK